MSTQRVSLHFLVVVLALGAGLWTLDAALTDRPAQAQTPVPPTVTAQFDPPLVEVGQETTLVVTIDNTANASDGDYTLTSTQLSGLDGSPTVGGSCELDNQPWTGGRDSDHRPDVGVR